MARGDKDGVEPVDAYVGQQIRVRRKSLGMSQKDLADAVGLSFQQVQKYEAGVNRLAASTLARCARALSCSPGDFFPADLEIHPSTPLFPLIALPGGAELEVLYRGMTPDQRQLLVVVARAFAATNKG